MVNKISVVMARDENGGVGFENQLPWPKISEDLACFKKVTINGIVLMGRKTWESIGSKSLPKRINIVISSNDVEGADYTVSGNLKDIVTEISDKYPNRKIYLIGGAKLVEDAITSDLVDEIHMTDVKYSYRYDKSFTINVLKDFNKVSEETIRECDPKVVYNYYTRKIDETV